jgi:hypothetical protein
MREQRVPSRFTIEMAPSCMASTIAPWARAW